MAYHDMAALNSPPPPGYISLYNFSRRHGYDLGWLVVAKDRKHIESETWLLRTQGEQKIWTTIIPEDAVPPAYVPRVDYRALAKREAERNGAEALPEEIAPAGPLAPDKPIATKKCSYSQGEATYSRTDLAKALGWNYKTLTYWMRRLDICKGPARMSEKEYLEAAAMLRDKPQENRTAPGRVDIEGREYISVREASKMLGYSRKYIRLLASTGRMPHARMLERTGASKKPSWYIPADTQMPERKYAARQSKV